MGCSMSSSIQPFVCTDTMKEPHNDNDHQDSSVSISQQQQQPDSLFGIISETSPPISPSQCAIDIYTKSPGNSLGEGSKSVQDMSSEKSSSLEIHKVPQDEKYYKVKKLGKGQYGTVFSVVHYESGKVYAMKEFKTPEKEMDVCKEINALEKCAGHPCIVQIKEVVLSSCGRMEGFVMEQVEGVPWGSSDFHRRHGPIPATPTCIRCLRGILRDILSGLLYLHETVGMAHMDIKPENVLVTVKCEKGKENNKKTSPLNPLGTYAKLIDLGGAIDANTLTTSTGGTYYYCSPEKL
eukprot:PhF_6_TR18900/c1_g1_i6/m.27555